MASQNFTQLRADGAYELRLEMSSVPNTSGNYSDVTYNLYVRSISSTAAYNYGYGNRVYLAINDSVILDTANIGRVTFTGPNQTHQFAYGTVKVNHNADGSKGIAVRAIFQQTQALSAANYDISGTFTLDTIPRTSVPTLSTASATLGATSVTLNTNRASTSFTHTLVGKIGSTTVLNVSGVGASYTWTPEESLAKYFTTTPSATIVTTCTTYNGSTAIGSKNVYLIVYVPDTMIPTCSLTVAEAASLPSGITGFIKGKSRLKVTVSASGVQGSTISGYSIKANGATYNATPATTEVLTTAGTNTITAFVRDSRGMASATASQNITVIDYTAPAISKLSAYRCTSDTDSMELDTGEYICAEFAGGITALSNQNGKALVVSYKKSSDTTWTDLTVDLSDYEFTGSVIFPADTDSSYDVKFALTDSFSTSTYTTTVSSGFTLINIPASGKGLAIGKVSETDELVDSAWNMQVINDGTRERTGLFIDNAIQQLGLYIHNYGQAGLAQFLNNKWNWLVYCDGDGNNYMKGTADLAAGLKIPAAGAYYTDANGNFVHNNADVSNFWNIRNNANTSTFRVWFENGNIETIGDIMQNGKSIVPLYYGNNGKGCIRFPNVKFQICWHDEYQGVKHINTAWGNMYESQEFNFTDWIFPFSERPVVFRQIVTESGGVMTQQYQVPSATNAGKVYAVRPSPLSNAHIDIRAIGFGRYA